MENEQGQVEETGANEGEIDGMKLENENLKRELGTRDGKIASLEKTLAEKNSELTGAKNSIEKALQDVKDYTASLAEAVAAYKELSGQANPGLVAEMIKGETIGEINTSVKNAKALVERVRQEVGAETARVRVPAGAPQRSMPDISALSAREKIKFAVEGR